MIRQQTHTARWQVGGKDLRRERSLSLVLSLAARFFIQLYDWCAPVHLFAKLSVVYRRCTRANNVPTWFARTGVYPRVYFVFASLVILEFYSRSALSDKHSILLAPSLWADRPLTHDPRDFASHDESVCATQVGSLLRRIFEGEVRYSTESPWLRELSTHTHGAHTHR